MFTVYDINVSLKYLSGFTNKYVFRNVKYSIMLIILRTFICICMYMHIILFYIQIYTSILPSNVFLTVGYKGN